MPPAAAALMKLLPPPSCFHGPFVQVDALMEILRSCELPETAEEAAGVVRRPESSSCARLPGKRVKRPPEDSDEEEGWGAAPPPLDDLYRARLRRRLQ